MNEKNYNILNNIFITISVILVVFAMIYDNLFNIIPQVILLFGGISTLINGKFEFKKYSRISFKQQFNLGILAIILVSLSIVGTILSAL